MQQEQAVRSTTRTEDVVEGEQRSSGRGAATTELLAKTDELLSDIDEELLDAEVDELVRSTIELIEALMDAGFSPCGCLGERSADA